MVESAGGRGRAGRGRPQPSCRRRGELSAARAARLPVHPHPCPGGEGAMASRKRRNEVRFLGPVAWGCGAASREPGVPERPGWGFRARFSAL